VKNLKVILGFLLFSLVGVVITGIVLNYFGIEHGSILVRTGLIFVAVNIILYLLLLIASVFRNLINVYIEKKRKAIG
jgi:membrane protein DedA with SNARE-associated domain